MTPAPITLRPIGIVESPLTDPAAAPCQGDEGAPECRLVLDQDMAAALYGIGIGDSVVVVTWLHRGDRSLRAVHPRGDPTRAQLGVFATRSPHRPNPIGLHTAQVMAVDGTCLRVSGVEAIDGTPILDLKPVLQPPGQR
ncbi:tRNA (N6-threonylcarbamoyladenosine(37)-N6)-methyltransferase TrmO [Skermania sp. ID1734]|uniref:tRNA (N6-threonylcarbamoyladenosine(37)-N6)-methyltransferase TrmO n=1 Tax=Skermania sp. ID1734 TaxID=2597516 RepID=UPI00118037C3|nr:tRNA (N6-threonylcarbamoyladenosine(37)-N6)-methyltransferase TrmO [Skermania sp. ID1734]TSE01677.1 tRNA (N6-threonylcarbamoyladenosine(37)-N6)-methyltransferase TrmO [Skermania sp. ID1734]